VTWSKASLALVCALVAALAAAGIYALNAPEQRREPPTSTLAPQAALPPPVTEPEEPQFPSSGTPSFEHELPPLALPPLDVPQKRYTLAERLDEIGPTARTRLTAKFQTAEVQWPPRQVVLVALKDENVVELHARSRTRAWRLVHRYPIHKASGGPGPKLRQGDRQVPEGIYRVTFLNPNSRYHVSMRLDYPNAFDQAMGARDGRSDLGGDIMIHGKALSVGCLAMGDEAAEELFVLAATVGLPKIKVIIAPTDFRKADPLPLADPTPPAALPPPWVPQLYVDIAREMAPFPRPL
jgi:hypothetical protein